MHRDIKAANILLDSNGIETVLIKNPFMAIILSVITLFDKFISLG